MLKLLRHLTGRELLLIFICLVFIVIQVWLSLKLLGFMAEITRLVQTRSHSMRAILSVPRVLAKRHW